MEFMYGIPSFLKFGNGVSKEVGEIAKNAFGAKNVFFIYDKGVKAAGIADGVLASLKDAGLNVTEFDGVLPNPPDTLVEEAATLARAANVDVTVALGGGSSIDVAKAINVLLTNPSPINQYNGMGLVKNPTKPLIAIPTASGTGSEVTTFSIVTDTKEQFKMVIGGPFVGATMALADPELTVGLPPAITASTGVDALTHAIEAYVSNWHMIPTDVNALKAIELISANLEEAVNNGSNVEARANMLLGAIMAGYAFNNAILGLVHSIAHPLSVHCGVPHGVANAVVLPYVMEFNTPACPERFKDIALAMGLDVANSTPEEASKAGVQFILDLYKKIDMPTLEGAGVPRDIFEKLSVEAVNEAGTVFNPRVPTPADVLAILEKAW